MMNLQPFLPRWFRRFGLDRRAIAAVEFAIIVPILLVMFIGVVEIVTLYRTEGKVNALAFNVAQMVSVELTDPPSSVPLTRNAAGQTSINDICKGAVLGLAPIPPKNLVINIASVTLEPSAQNSNIAATPAVFDEWEAQSTVTGTTCSTTATAAIGPAVAESLATTNPPVNTVTSNYQVDNAVGGNPAAKGAVEVPCDNMIIVTVTMTYPGYIGDLLPTRPTLTQTAYSRFRYASPQEELLCSNCALNQAPLALCDAASTATD